VTQGSHVEAGATVLRLADLTHLWCEVQVPESEIASVRPGQPAALELPSEPGRRREATVTALVPMVDERTRAATARLELENPDGALKPGMFARVRVRTRTEAAALLIPADAVLDTGERQLVWIALGGGRFEPRTVRLGAAGEGGVVQVLDGLAAGESVVVSGQFLIDAESRLREATRRFSAKDRLTADSPPTGAAPAGGPIDVDAAAQQELDALCRSYLALQQALAADRDDAEAWRALRAPLLQLATGLPAAAQPLAAALQSALPAADGDLAGHRAAFATVSQEALALFETAPPSASVAKELVVAWCPMKSAGWLQVGMPLHNPYYGSSMPECGEVKKRLTARGDTRR
jgi:Cu(I)/Ag(I) efflux system membrane fusion protein